MGFLDSLGDTLNRGVAATGRSASTMKLRGQLNDLLKQRQALAAQLGASLYDATKDDEGLRKGREPLYDGIAAIDDQRAAVQDEIARLEAESQASAIAARSYICPNCGNRVSEGDLFCSGCGTPIDQIRASYPETAYPDAAPVRGYCGKCGAPLNQGDQFCMSCGAPVDAGV